ncbi:hypothetical protein SDC9_199571 [bioreactor metagenome]|uniref:Uncharacterized protein n=1 Tax=bioreactor metagenome TaxID=1076179 RepID=A0A645ILE6_9ZZZZ
MAAKNVKKPKHTKISLTIVVELLLALYFVFGIGVSIFYKEIAAIPFQVMFLFGFGTIGILSLRHAILSRKKYS